jgi:L-rhamnose mutarotase
MTVIMDSHQVDSALEYATKVQAQSPIVDKWNEYMKDILIMEMDPITGAQPQLKKVFSFKEK